MIIGHGGNIHEMAKKLGCRAVDIIDMSSNLNPTGPPPGLVEHLKDNMTAILALPEADARSITAALAEQYGIDSQRVLAGNGTTQFIYSIPPALNARKALIVGPTYADYADACRMHGTEFSYFMTGETCDFRPDLGQLAEATKGFDTVFICNPNNPTGALIEPAELEMLCASQPDTRFLIDESYLPFVDGGEAKSMAGLNLPNVIVLNSMSKMFRIPGLRIGFLIASPNIIGRFQAYMLPWSVNALAQTAVLYLMERKNEIESFIQNTRTLIQTEKEFVLKGLADAPGLKLFPTTTCFLLARLPQGLTSDVVFDQMAQSRILIRNCENFNGLSNRFIRFSLKMRPENEILVERLSAIISEYGGL